MKQKGLDNIPKKEEPFLISYAGKQFSSLVELANSGLGLQIRLGACRRIRMSVRKTSGSLGGYRRSHDRLELEEPIQMLIKRKLGRQY